VKPFHQDASKICSRVGENVTKANICLVFLNFVFPLRISRFLIFWVLCCFFMAALCNRGHYIFCPVLSIFLLLSSIFFSRLISAVADWMSTILRHMVWPYANLECKSETCCTRFAVNTGRKKSPSQHHRSTLSDHIFATKARIDNRKKKTC